MLYILLSPWVSSEASKYLAVFLYLGIEAERYESLSKRVCCLQTIDRVTYFYKVQKHYHCFVFGACKLGTLYVRKSFQHLLLLLWKIISIFLASGISSRKARDCVFQFLKIDFLKQWHYKPPGSSVGRLTSHLSFCFQTHFRLAALRIKTNCLLDGGNISCIRERAWLTDPRGIPDVPPRALTDTLSSEGSRPKSSTWNVPNVHMLCIFFFFF